MDFATAIRTCLSKYVDFNGRAARPEYWWFALFCILTQIGAEIVGVAAASLGNILTIIVLLATLLPTLAVTARRLHDTDRSGWWMLIGLVPVLGWIALIVFTVQKGTEGENRFGPPA